MPTLFICEGNDDDEDEGEVGKDSVLELALKFILIPTALFVLFFTAVVAFKPLLTNPLIILILAPGRHRHRVYRVYSVYRVYRVYIVYSVCSVCSLCSVYRVYSVYSVYSVSLIIYRPKRRDILKHFSDLLLPLLCLSIPLSLLFSQIYPFFTFVLIFLCTYIIQTILHLYSYFCVYTLYTLYYICTQIDPHLTDARAVRYQTESFSSYD